MADYQTSFKYREEFEDYLDEVGVSKSDVCLVGSIVLSLRNIREHGDLDFCAHSSVEDRFKNVEPPDGIGYHEKKYGNIDVACDELIENEDYHDVFDGLKVAKFELEFSHKLHRNWPKDEHDIAQIERTITKDPDWNWDLVILPPSEPEKPLHERLWNSVKSRGVYRTVHTMVDSLRTPGSFTWLDRLDRPLTDIRTAGMIGDELTPYSSIGLLLSQQYQDSEFDRMDFVEGYALLRERGPQSTSALENYPPAEEFNPGTEDLLPLGEDADRIGLGRDLEIHQNAGLLPLYSYYGYDKLPVGLGSRAPQDQIPCPSMDLDEQMKKQYHHELLAKHGCYFFAVLWPQSLSHHDEIVSAIDDRFSVLHSVDLEVDGPEELRLLARQIYSVQREFSWYTRECVAEKLSTDGTNIRIVVFEVPNPSYDRSINLEEPVAIEVRDFKAQIRNEYDGERIMHASDNYRHNQELMKVFERSPIPNSGEVVDHSAYRKLSTEIRSS